MIWADRVAVVVLIATLLIAGASGAEDKGLALAFYGPVCFWALLRGIDWIATGEFRWINRGVLPITLWDRRPR